MEVSTLPKQQLSLFHGSEAEYFSEEQKATISFEAIHTSLMLFQFGKTDRKSAVATKFTSILPNGGVRTIRVEAETLESKNSEQSRTAKGLPGAAAQDALIGIMDLAISKMEKEQEEDIHFLEWAEDRDQSDMAKMIDLNHEKSQKRPPKAWNTVGFKIKDLAKIMGINEKSSQIRRNIEHLKRTTFKVIGTTYFNGKDEQLSYDGYYINEIYYAKKMGASSEDGYLYVTLNEKIFGNIVENKIAKMSREKYNQLPSGVLRKLLTVISSKAQAIAQPGKSTTLYITVDELLALTQISEKTFANKRESYFRELVEIGAIEEYLFSRRANHSCVVVRVPPDLSGEEVKHIYEAKKYMGVLNAARTYNKGLNTFMSNTQIFDLNEEYLATLIKKYPDTELFNKRVYNKVVLLLDKLITTESKDPWIKKSLCSLLAHYLEGKGEFRQPANYIPIPSLHFERIAKEKAQVERALAERQEEELKNALAIQADKIFAKFKESDLSGVRELYNFDLTTEEVFAATTKSYIVEAIRDAVSLETASDLADYIRIQKMKSELSP
ncbi:hypothetical protein [Bdellovibrio sp. BCCA]|uniref:hypothetical protein n=1 Tax=Bdellovibrio sp. BCCA TaxID=3136281 RepID=UPI0030EFEB71